MLAFSKEVNLEETAKLGRFKLTGVNSCIGIHGTLAFLVEQTWTDVEVLYVGEQHAVFLAGSIGEYGPMNYLFQGALRQLQFTALNAQAKQMIKTFSTSGTASAGASAPASASNRVNKKKIYDHMMIHSPGLAKAAASPVRKPEKRTPATPTGETPGAKQLKDGL